MGSACDTSSLPLSYLTPGRRIASRYEIIEELGRGGMGVTLKVKDLTLAGEVVALKILYPRFAQSSNTLARFRREVLLARRLSHPSIVKIFELGVTQDTETGETLQYLTMEWVAGESLAAKIKRNAPNALPIKEITHIVHSAALALDLAHRFEVIHGDLKPSNIIIGHNGIVKISDFGVARSIDCAEQRARTDAAIGSAVYISPEQISAERVDALSDIYSLGVIAYELAAGALPFAAVKFPTTPQVQVSRSVPRLTASANGGAIPGWFVELIARACVKDRSKRLQSGLEVATHIERSDPSCIAVVRSFRSALLHPLAAMRDRSDHLANRFLAPGAAMLVVALVVSGGYAMLDQLVGTLGR